MSEMILVRNKLAWLSLGTVLFGGCASPTHTVDPYPAETDPQHNTYAYEAEDGTNLPATSDDATIAAGAAAVDTALGMGRKPSAGHANQITGYCEIVSQGSRLPCTSIAIALKQADGTALSQDRTREDGTFSFQAKRGVRYLLEVESKQFIVKFKPAMPLHAGAVVRVRLRPRTG